MLRNSPLVAEGDEGVIYHQDVVQQLTSWTNAVRIIGITLIAVLALVSVFIIL